MKRWMSQSGFTLIELVMVIVILGILASVAVPKFTDLSTQAKNAATAGVVGGVRSGIGIYYATSGISGTAHYPTTLDNGSAGRAGDGNAFFTVVLGQNGITYPNWERTSGATTPPVAYWAPNNVQYSYSDSGTFDSTNRR